MFEKDGVRLSEPCPGCTAMLDSVAYDPVERRFEVSDRLIQHEMLELAFGEHTTYIGQAEELAVAGACETHAAMLADRDVISFVDNQGALGILVSGSLSNRPMARLAHQVAERQSRLKTRFFYEYVNSSANIADLPSRGDAKRACRMLREHFGMPVWYRHMVLPRLTAL